MNVALDKGTFSHRCEGFGHLLKEIARNDDPFAEVRLRSPIRAREQNVSGGHTLQSVSSIVYAS